MPRTKRLLFLVLSACVLASFFTSCGAQKTVLSYGSQTLSERQFTYALMLQKTKTLSALTGTTENLTDSAEIWATDDGTGTTLGERLFQSVYDEARISLFYRDYAAKNGVTLSSEESAAAKQSADDIVSAFSSREAFENYMKTYGADYQLILEYYNDLALTEAGMKAYYSAPVTALTPADCRACFRENYVTCRYYFFSLASKTLPNGKTVPLDEEERAAVLEKATLLKDALAAGEEILPYLDGAETFSFASGAPQTVLISSLPDGLSDALCSAPDGTVEAMTADSGVYLYEKLALDADAFDSLANEIYTAVVSERESAILEDVQNDFVKDERFFRALSVTDTPIFSD